jgi:hypothetical protein
VSDVEAGRMPRKRRRVWPWVLLVMLVLLVLGVIYAGDAIARPIAQEAVAQKVASSLGVSPGDLKVRFAPAPLPLQLLDGRVDTLDIDAPNLTLGPLVGDAVLHAERVPIDQSAPIGDLTVTLTVDEQRLSGVASKFGGGLLSSLDLKAPDVVANGQVAVFGVPVPLGVSFTPGAVDGKLAFTPTAVTVGGKTLTLAQLRQFAPLKAFAQDLGRQQTVCIADHLPRAVTITSVRVRGKDLVAVASGSGAVLSQLGTKGTC